MKHSKATLKSVGQEILRHYASFRPTPSGTFTISQLNFSSNPSRWNMQFLTSIGDHYTRTCKYRRTNLEIQATLSPAWIEDPAPFLLPNGFAAGSRPLDPPPFVDSLHFLHAYQLHGNRLALRHQPFLRFTSGPVHYDHKLKNPSPKTLPREIRLGSAVFQKIIAKRVAQRLAPAS